MTKQATAPTAAILIIGEEVLSGKVADENSPFLLRELRKLGVAVRRVEIIPDDIETIGERVRTLASTYDHVFTAGGIGPTHDDVTIAGIARAFSVPVVKEEAMVRIIRTLCVEDFHERDLHMAHVPLGADLIFGDGPVRSHWPVVAMKNVYCLPGIPKILFSKFALLRSRLVSDPFYTRAVYSREGEGAIAGHLDKLVSAYPEVTIGSYPHLDTLDHKVMITLDGRNPTAVDAAMQALVTALGPAFVRYE
jgi:molybdenum cofactor synthesis domain-containing protein